MNYIPPSSALIEIAPALYERLPALCALIVERVQQLLPAYLAVPAQETGTFENSVRRNVECLLALLTRHGPNDLAAPRDTGRSRAEQGVPVADMLRGYHLEFALLWEAMAEEIHRSGRSSANELAEVGSALWWGSGQLLAEATASYRDTSAELIAQREQQQAALIEALISGGGSPGMLREVAAKLGMSYEGPFVAVVADASEIGSQSLPGVARRLREEGIHSVWRLMPKQQIGIVSLPPHAPHPLDTVIGVLSVLNTSALIGISPVYAALDSTPRGVYLAKLALGAIATAPVEGCPTVRQFTAAPLDSLIAAAPEAAISVARVVLGPLLQLPREEQDVLLDTLEMWLASDGSATQSAQRLFCHPNTVRYRLRRIAEQTGRSVEHPAETVELAAALHSLRLLPEVR